MNIDPKGRIPETGIMKAGDVYHGAAGIGLIIMSHEKGRMNSPWDTIDTTRESIFPNKMSSKYCSNNRQREWNKQPHCNYFHNYHGRDGIDSIIRNGNCIQDRDSWDNCNRKKQTSCDHCFLPFRATFCSDWRKLLSAKENSRKIIKIYTYKKSLR